MMSSILASKNNHPDVVGLEIVRYLLNSKEEEEKIIWDDVQPRRIAVNEYSACEG